MTDKQAKCPDCLGSGLLEEREQPPIPCLACDGSGKKAATEQNRLLTAEDIVPYLKALYPHLYEGNDKAWCRMRESALLLLLRSYDVELLLEAQREMTLREVGEWLDTKWVSYGTFGFIKLSDEEMKALKQGKFPEGG